MLWKEGNDVMKRNGFMTATAFAMEIWVLGWLALFTSG
jgi:hypothetical protein